MATLFHFQLISVVSIISTLQTVFGERITCNSSNPCADLIVCGFNGPCSITCYTNTSGCNNNQFYFYNDNINLTCIGFESCRYAQINSINATSLDISMIGHSSFKEGIAFIDNANVTTRCIGIASCVYSRWYYSGKNSIVEHFCDCPYNDASCRLAVISAITINSLWFLCGGMDINWASSCWQTLVYLPFNSSSKSIIEATTNRNGEVYIYCMNGPKHVTKRCTGECDKINTNLKGFFMIYGLRYEYVCELSNITCNSYEIDVDQNYYDVMLYLNDWMYNNPNYQNIANMNENVIIFIPPAISGLHSRYNSILTTPMVNNVTILCMDYRHFSSTEQIIFDLSNSYTVNMICNNIDLSTIIGPINIFNRIAYEAGSATNIWYMQHTQIVNMKCNILHWYGSCLMEGSELYIGNSTDLTLGCGCYDCRYSTVYTTFDYDILNQYIDNLRNLIDITCCSQINSCLDFGIEFTTINRKCNYTIDNDPNCNMLTYSPTFSPTFSPTISPSFTPTYVTKSPTISPTFSPTLSPTRVPIEFNRYNKIINIQFILANLTINNLQTVNIIDIQFILEEIYQQVSLDYDEILQYQELEIIINEIIYERVSIKLPTNIYVDDSKIANIIVFASQGNTFQQIGQYKMRSHFNNKYLQFIVGEAMIDTTKEESNSFFSKYFLYIYIAIMSIVFVIGGAAFVYNKKSKSLTDNGEYIAIILFGLQCIDLITDINLSYELLVLSNSNNELLLHFATFGSITFLLIPYLTNIIIASQIKKLIKNNYFAKLYFEQNVTLFIGLVVICGSSYSSLLLISSRIFGLNILDSGLTLYELNNNLRWIKIIGNILLENIPQVIFGQLLYIIYLGGNPSQNAILALIASLLSIIIAILSQIVYNQSNDCHVIQYDLEIKCINGKTFNKNDKENINNLKGRKFTLTQYITESLGVDNGCIELGKIILIPNGFVIHCIHYLFEDNLNTLKDNLNIDQTDNIDINNINDIDEEYYKQLSKTFVSNLYERNKNKVINAIIEHFNFYNKDITLTYYDKFGYNHLIRAKTVFNDEQTQLTHIHHQNN